MKTCKKCGGIKFYKDGHCVPCTLLYKHKRRIENLQICTEIERKSYAKHAIKRRAGKVKYRSENPEKCRLAVLKSHLKNPEKKRTSNRNRKAKLRNIGGKLSELLTEKLYNLQKGKCSCCSKPLGKHYHLDHIVPLALGGANEDWNIQLLTATCNMQKGKKDPVDFMRSKGFLL